MRPDRGPAPGVGHARRGAGGRAALAECAACRSAIQRDACEHPSLGGQRCRGQRPTGERDHVRPDGVEPTSVVRRRAPPMIAVLVDRAPGGGRSRASASSWRPCRRQCADLSPPRRGDRVRDRELGASSRCGQVLGAAIRWRITAASLTAPSHVNVDDPASDRRTCTRRLGHSTASAWRGARPGASPVRGGHRLPLADRSRRVDLAVRAIRPPAHVRLAWSIPRQMARAVTLGQRRLGTGPAGRDDRAAAATGGRFADRACIVWAP